MPTREQRLSAACLSLEGLSVGDAAGGERLADTHPWRYSDDTVMAMAIVEVLATHGAIDQDALANAFATRFERDPERGYGAVAYWLLHQLTLQQDWRVVSRQVFQRGGIARQRRCHVPFALWCAAHHLDDYEGGIRTALSGCEAPAADPDTVCAIVGSIVVLSSGVDSIPGAWRHAREPLEL